MALEDEFYIRRLDAGLFCLQLIDCIIMEVCSSGVASVKNLVILMYCLNPFVSLNISNWVKLTSSLTAITRVEK